MSNLLGHLKFEFSSLICKNYHKLYSLRSSFQFDLLSQRYGQMTAAKNITIQKEFKHVIGYIWKSKLPTSISFCLMTYMSKYQNVNSHATLLD